LELSLRILIIGDIHNDLEHLGAVVFMCSNLELDLIVLTGDFADFLPHTIPQIKNSRTYRAAENIYYTQLQAIFKLLATLNVPIVYVHGNHDLRFYDEKFHKLAYNVDLLSGNEKYIHNNFLAFVGFGGSTYTPFRGPYEWKDSIHTFLEIHQKLANLKPWILISHCPPKWCQFLDVGYIQGNHLGSAQVREIIAEFSPKVVITGHIHEGSGIDLVDGALVINAGKLAGYDRVELHDSSIYKENIAQVIKWFILEFDDSFDNLNVQRHGLVFGPRPLALKANPITLKNGELVQNGDIIPVTGNVRYGLDDI